MIRWLSVGALLTLSAPAFAATGGPDLYGYRWVDNGEQDGPSVDEWQDAWLQGEPFIDQDDQCRTDNPNRPDETTDLPFAFNYYGIDRTSLNICSNGFVYFGDNHLNNNNYNRNNNIPDNTPPDGVLAIAWTDIDPSNGRDSGVWVTRSEQEYVIAWRAPHYQGQVTNTFAIRLTPNGEITYYYQTLSTQFPRTASELITIGIESPEGNFGCCTIGAEGAEANFGVFFGDTNEWRNEGFPFPALENYAMRFFWEPLAYAPEIEPIGDKVVSVGAVLQFTVEASDQDEGDVVTLGVANLPDGATFNAQTGLFRFQPTEGQVGEHVVTFTARDDGNPSRSDEEVVTITVQRTNQPPVVTSTAPTSAQSGQQYVYDIEATDPDGDTLRFRLRGGNNNPPGAQINQTTGVVTWTPDDEFSGEVVNFSVLVDDGEGGIVLHNWQVGIDDAPPVNNPPVITSNPPTTAIVGQQLVYQVVASDPDGHTLTYDLVRNCPAGAAIDRDSGRFTYTPGNNELGEQVTCIIRVRDSVGAITAQSMSISVQAEPPPENQPPVYTTQPPRNATVGGVYSYDADAVDPEGTPLRFFLSNAPNGAFVNPVSGIIQWEPSLDQRGTQQDFTLEVEDGGGLRTSQSWTVTVSDQVNRAPIITSSPESEAYPGVEYVYVVLATDPDGDSMTFSLDPLRSPDGATMDEQGRVTWTPNQAQVGQIVSFRVTVVDANGADTNQDFSVTVTEEEPPNRDPVFTSSPPTTATVGVVYTYTATTTDADGDALTLVAELLPDGATLRGATITWTPVLAEVGQQTFRLNVTDGNGGGTQQNWSVTVQEAEPPNTAPIFTSQAPNTAEVGVEYRYQATWTDAEGHAVTFRLVSGPAGMQADADGLVTWTPSEAQAGISHTMVLELRDSEGATTELRVDIGVDELDQNNAPVITSQASGQATVGQAYSYRPVATDEDGDSVTFVLTEAPAGARFVGGAVAWVPSDAQGDQELRFTLRASDGNGGQDEQTWIVRVSPDVGNRAPSITSEAVTSATVGVLYRYQVTATDPDNDTLVFLLPQDQDPPTGMIIDSETGVITWTPSQEQGGITHRVVVAVVDEGGLFDAQSFQVGVGVPVNEPPRITSSAPAEAQPRVQYVYQVIATDPEGETLRFFTDPDRCPDGASINVLTGRFTWTPSLTDAGSTVSCVIGVVDPSDNADLQQITIQVAGEVENRDPVIASQPATTATQASPYIYNIIATDADGDELTYTLVSGPPGARIQSRGPINGVIWLIPPGSAGQDFDFEIRVSDGNGGVTSQAWTVSVTDGEPNQPPIITSTPSGTGSPGVVYQYQVQAFDLEREELTYTLEVAPAGAEITEGGNITWTPTEGQGGQAQAFRLVVSDPRGGEARQEWNVEVSGDPPPPVNNPPVVTSVAPTQATVGQEYSYQAQATDEDGDPLFWVLPEDEDPPAGMTINASTGEITWTPSEAGIFRVTVAVTDGTAFAGQVFQISVDSGQANRPPAFTSDPPTQATAGEQLVYVATAEDPDGDAVRFFLFEEGEDCPQGMTINQVTGQLLYTPPASLLGSTVSCVLVAVDTNGLANTQALAIQITDGAPANNAPRITSTPPELAIVGEQYTYSGQATDEDGDVLGWVMTSGPAGAVINSSTGVLTWTPVLEDVGTVSFAVEVRDGRGGINRQQWDVVVREGDLNNQAPEITSNPPTSARVLAAFTYEPVATDADDDELTWRLLEAPAGARINAETGAVSWQPTPLFENREVVFQIEVSDGNDNDRQRWTVRVDPQQSGNNPPSITSSPSTQVFLGNDYTISLSASDPDGDPLSWRLVNAPEGTRLTGAGALDWSPDLGDLGESYDFVVGVLDGRGGTDRLSWQVTVPNRAPEITTDPVVEAVVGEAYRYDVGATDEDPGQPLTYRITSRPPLGMSINAQSGLITWIPSEEQGQETFLVIVRVEDTLGSFDEQSYRVGVDVPPSNRAPTISNTAPDRASAGVLYTFDYEARDLDGDALSWELESGPPGMTIDRDTGVLRWTPSDAQTGQTLSFVVRVSDDEGLFDRQTVLVLVEVEANTPPAFGNEPETEAVVGQEYLFEPRVSDEDADPVSVQLVAGPPSAECSDGRCNRLTWTPDAEGTFSFQLIATDDRGAEAELRWTVLVTEPGANSAPTFTSTPPTTAQIGEEYLYTARAQDPDADRLVYSLAAASPVLMNIDAETGEISWTPTEEDLGPNDVVVQVSDGRGGTDLQTYVLEVIDEFANNPPVITSEAITVAVAEVAYEYRIRANDPDEDDVLSFSLKAGPGGMEVTEDEGLVTWLPPVEAVDQAVLVQVEVTDGEDVVLHEWVITVQDNPDIAPIANAGLDRTVDPGVIELDGSASIDPLAQGLRYVWSAVGGPQEVTIDDPSLAIATVELLYPGDYTFKLQVTAPGDRSAEDEVVITVRYNGPIAIAGEDQRVELPVTGDPALVTLAGEAVVLEEDTPTYRWEQVGGPEIDLNGGDTPNPEFKALDPGVYVFDLVVGDGELESTPDTVVISVVEPDESEAANWGVDETACGCAGSPFGDLAWLLFAVVALRRRRIA